MSGLVRIRLRALADRGPLRARRVAVVDRRPDRACAGRSACSARAWSWASALVGYRYSARARRVGGEHLERRQLEAERLARRGAGGDDRRAARTPRTAPRPGGRRAGRCRRSERARLTAGESSSGCRRGRAGARLVQSPRGRAARPRGPARAGRPTARLRCVDRPSRRRVWRRLLRSPPPCAACTSISTGRCSGRAARCCAAPTARFALDGVRALQACWRADVEVVLYSGRRQRSVFETSRLIGALGLHLRARVRAGARRRARVADRRVRALGRATARSSSRSSARARRRCCSSASRAGSSTTRRGRSAARSRTCSAARSTSARRARWLDGAGLGLAAPGRQRRGPRARRADGRARRSSAPTT